MSATNGCWWKLSLWRFCCADPGSIEVGYRPLSLMRIKYRTRANGLREKNLCKWESTSISCVRHTRKPNDRIWRFTQLAKLRFSHPSVIVIPYFFHFFEKYTCIARSANAADSLSTCHRCCGIHSWLESPGLATWKLGTNVFLCFCFAFLCIDKQTFFTFLCRIVVYGLFPVVLIYNKPALRASEEVKCTASFLSLNVEQPVMRSANDRPARKSPFEKVQRKAGHERIEL